MGSASAKLVILWEQSHMLFKMVSGNFSRERALMMVIPEQPQLKLPAYRHAVILDGKGAEDIGYGTD